MSSSIPYLFTIPSLQSTSLHSEWEGMLSPVNLSPRVNSNTIVSSTLPVVIQGLGGGGYRATSTTMKVTS